MHFLVRYYPKGECKMKDSNEPVNIRPFAYAISLINGKWKMHILFYLWHEDVLRYNQLKRRLGKVTHKMLSNQLKELEADGVILRKEYPQVPPKVEYSLTDLGISLMPVLDTLCKWGHKNVPDEWEME